MTPRDSDAVRCSRCGSDNVRPEFEQVGGQLDMVQLTCGSCGATGPRHGE